MSEQSVGGQPALYGGISLQPESIRQPHQVADAENVTFSVVDGMSKRPPMWWVADVLTAPAATDLRLHAIYRDENEKYLVVYGLGFLSVIEVGGRRSGQACTVNLGSGVSTYLATNNPTAKDLKLVTVGDTTYIVNTKVAVGTLASPTYTVAGTARDADVLFSTTPADGTYWRARADTTTQASGYFLYDLTSGGGGTFATYRGAGNGQGGNDARFATPSGFWDDAATIDGVFYIGCQRFDLNIAGGTWTAATLTLTKTGAFTSYTLEDGDQVYITGGTGHTAGWYSIATRVSNDAITLQPATGLSGADNANTTTDAIGTAVVFSIATPGIGAADMYDVALNIQNSARAAGGVARNVCVTWQPAYSGGYFLVTSPYRGSSATMFVPTYVSGYNHVASTAPFSATSGQYVITAGTGSPTEQELDVEDRWSRQTAPDQPDARPDPAKMPVAMTRTTVGSGSTAAVFNVAQITWDSRPSGDETSNPLPDLFLEEETIADIAFQHDRLMLFGGEFAAVGEAGNLYNFFVQDEGTIVDSDAFGRRLASDVYTRISHAVPINKTLYLFTEANRQFALAGGDTFTPTTAAFTPTTSYQTLNVRPRPIHDRLYFASLEKDKAALREYQFVQDRESNVAADVSAHVPGLLPTTVQTLATSPNDNVAVLSANDSDVLYVYRAHWSGDQKIQSAWTKFSLSAVTVYGIASIKSDIYVMLRRDEIGVTIERFGVGDIVEDSADDLYPPNIAFPVQAAAYVLVPTTGGESSVNPPPATAYAALPSYTSIVDDGGSDCTTYCASHTSTDCGYCASSYVDGRGDIYALCSCTTTLTCSDSSPRGGTCCYASTAAGVSRFQQTLCTSVAVDVADTATGDTPNDSGEVIQ